MFRELRGANKKLAMKDCIEGLENETRGILSVMDDNDYPYGTPMNYWHNVEDGIMNDTKEILIRMATVEDAEGIFHVYAPYVKNTAISFEYEVPSIQEMKNRIEKTLQKYPYFVAVQEERIIGYAYAGPFIGRPAYAWSVELSIYIDSDMKRAGIGGRLYHRMEEELKKKGITNMYACIGYPEVEDEYLNRNSVEFHEHLGFRMVGRFYKCGYKFNRWYDMVWMEKIIGTHFV